MDVWYLDRWIYKKYLQKSSFCTKSAHLWMEMKNGSYRNINAKVKSQKKEGAKKMMNAIKEKFWSKNSTINNIPKARKNKLQASQKYPKLTRSWLDEIQKTG